MKNIFGKVLTVASASIMLASCDLNLYPEAKIVYDPDQGFFATANDIESSHNTVYTYFKSTVGGAYAYMEELMFEGFNALADYGNNYGPIHKTDQNFTAGDDDVTSFWGVHYLAMKNYNIIITSAEAESTPENLRDMARFVKGEACAARAYSYLQLARHFAGDYNPATAETDLCVPLVTVYDQNARPARATMKAVYDQIKADLDSAAVILAENEVENVANSMYFTPDVVRALQARYLFDTKSYQAAADTAMAVINSGLYTLAETQADFNKIYSESTGAEAIMELYASEDESSNGYSSAFTSYGKNSNSSTGYAYSPYFLPSKTLMDMYENNDMRKIGWFLQTTKDPLYTNGSEYNNVYVFSKFAGDPTLSTSGLPNGQVKIKPFLISEMYLIAAESYLNVGDNASGRKVLNQLQAKRKTSITAFKLEAIQTEWIRETVGEGFRMTNAKRWKKGFNGRAAQTNAINLVAQTPKSSFEEKVFANDDIHMTWPIPAYELRINTNLVQNPGYGDSKE